MEEWDGHVVGAGEVVRWGLRLLGKKRQRGRVGLC